MAGSEADPIFVPPHRVLHGRPPTLGPLHLADGTMNLRVLPPQPCREDGAQSANYNE